MSTVCTIVGCKNCAAVEYTKAGNAEALRQLHLEGAKLENVRCDGFNLAHLAVVSGHPKCLRMIRDICGVDFILQGYTPNSPNIKTCNLAWKAVDNGRANCLNDIHLICGRKYMMDHSPNLHNTLAHLAAKAGDSICIKALADTMGVQFLFIHNTNGFTAAHFAVGFPDQNNGVAVLEALRHAGTESIFNIENDDGLLPLHVAAGHGYVEAVEHLIEHGSPIFHRNKVGEHASHCACRHGHTEVLRYLIKYNKLFGKLPTYDGVYPVHLAATGGSVQCIELIVESAGTQHLHKAVDRKGCTVASYAAHFGKLNVLVWLHKQKQLTRLWAYSQSTGTPILQLAVDANHQNVVNFLQKTFNAEQQASLVEAKEPPSREELLNRLRSKTGRR